MKLTDRDLENIVYLAKEHKREKVCSAAWADELTTLINNCLDEMIRLDRIGSIRRRFTLGGRILW
jgi:putative aminopeptidase FrvX